MRLLSTLLIFLSCYAHGAVTNLIPVADTSLKELLATNNYGGLPFLMSGGAQVTPRRHRALLKFDLSVLPQSAKINSAVLVLEVTGEPANASPPPASQFHLYRMLASWGEGDNLSPTNCQSCEGLGLPAQIGEATWNDAHFAQQEWLAPGAEGNFANEPSFSEFVYGMIDSPYRFGPSLRVTQDVELWHKQPETNFGWILLSSNEDVAFTARRFGSRESAAPPILQISFTTVPSLNAELVNGQISLSFQTTPETTYFVQSKTNISDSWSNVQPVAGDGGRAELLLPINKGSEFFRIAIP